MAQAGVFREVDPPGRLVMTERFDEQSYPGDTLITHAFTETDGVTTVSSTVRYATPEGRAAVLRYPMARGVAVIRRWPGARHAWRPGTSSAPCT